MRGAPGDRAAPARAGRREEGAPARRGRHRGAAQRRVLRAPPAAAREDDRARRSSIDRREDPTLIAGVVTRIGDTRLRRLAPHAPARARKHAPARRRLTARRFHPPCYPAREIPRGDHAMQLRAEEISADHQEADPELREGRAHDRDRHGPQRRRRHRARLRPRRGDGRRAPRVPRQPDGPGAQPRDATTSARCCFGDASEHQGGRDRQAHRAASWTCPWARRSSAAS